MCRSAFEEEDEERKEMDLNGLKSDVVPIEGDEVPQQSQEFILSRDMVTAHEEHSQHSQTSDTEFCTVGADDIPLEDDKNSQQSQESNVDLDSDKKTHEHPAHLRGKEIGLYCANEEEQACDEQGFELVVSSHTV